MEVILRIFLNIHQYSKNVTLVLIVCVFYNKEVVAQEFLKPQLPIEFIPLEFLQYKVFVREAFRDAFSEGALLGVVVTESFEKEHVLYVKKEKNSTYLYFKEAESNYWTDFRKIKIPKPIVVCRLKIENEIENSLDDIWRSELLNTRYTKNEMGMMDGVVYSFYVDNSVDPDNIMVPKSAMQGETQSPEADSRMGRFVQLTKALKTSCINNGLSVEASKLMREFAK